MEGRPIVHIEIPAADRKATAEFYAKMFGWGYEHHVEGEIEYTMYRSGSVAGGFPDVGEGARPGEVLIYLASEDIEADLKQIEALGGKTVVPKSEVGEWGWYGVFTDPTGNRVALWTLRE